ncbi:cytoskeletal protein binding protein [Coemansia biformis]|uniref:Actin cytoskeleton-regulatory complex protein SLA1 n=1 Tax=Coemansia biformis TaxID=1286918 RepID=A0A9W8CWX0_9FUNG|nr:cytoskeletal protein binding protein [Coemansia biformis]
MATFSPPPAQQPPKPANTISHFNVTLGKKKKGRRITLGVSNQSLVIDEHDDASPPKKHPTGDIAKCTAKKSVVGVDVGGYAPATYELTCSSSAEAERIADSINAARRGMFIGDRVLDTKADSMPPPLPPKDSTPFTPPPAALASAQTGQPAYPLSAPAATRGYALVLYGFSSDEPEELTVNEGDRVLVLDRSDVEWWQVQLSPPHGNAGLVPAAYLELQVGSLGGDSGSRRSTVVDSLPSLPKRTDTARDAMARVTNEPRALDVAATARPGRRSRAGTGTSLTSAFDKSPDSDNMPLHALQSRQAAATAAGPDPRKVRKWTDGTGAYTVDAAFVRLDADGTVHLHKSNNKQISVLLSKFSQEDQRYVAGLNGTPPQQVEKPATARQRQQEQARKTPGRRIINYDWDWFDFFTLKCGISADNALKYATSFVAERLDDESIPELNTDYMRTLGVKPDDIPRMDRAFHVHRGLQVDAAEPQREGRSSSTPSPLGSEPPLMNPRAAAASHANESPYSPATPGSLDGSAEQTPHRTANDPWGVDSELDRRVDRYKQIESDEAFARDLQKREEDKRRRTRDRKHSIKQKVLGRRAESQPATDPFDALDAPASPSGSQAPPARPVNKQPLNLAAGSRKANRSQTSFVDPAQLRPAQQRLGSPVGAAVLSSPTSATGVKSPGQAAIDEAFGSARSTSPRTGAPLQSEPQAPSPRARPTVRYDQQQSIGSVAQFTAAFPAALPAASASQSALLGPSDLTTNKMAAAAASGNTAQVNHLEQMAIARAHELAAQEAHIRQQQEEIRKQALVLQQQQQQLLQMQQTQKVEAQLKQLKDENERLEKQRQTEELQKQIVALKAQQEQMLKMQQMASQVRNVQQNGSAMPAMNMPVPQYHQSSPGMSLTGMATPMTAMPSAQQPLQQQVPLSRRLPPPLVPTKVGKPLTPQPGHIPFGLQQQPQQQQLGGANHLSAAGIFGASQGVSNLPIASSSTTRLMPAAASGVFSNHSIAGSTPNLGSFASSNPVFGTSALGAGGGSGNAAAYASNAGAAQGMGNFGSSLGGQIGGMGQLVPQQRMLAMGGGAAPMNQAASKYDLFKSINPHSPSIFSGMQQPQMQQQQLQPQGMPGTMGLQMTGVVTMAQPAGFSASGSQPQRPAGPTGIFAMANPTLTQQPQQTPNMMAGGVTNLQQLQQLQQQQQQQQQQQLFGASQAGGFGGQTQWR